MKKLLMAALLLALLPACIKKKKDKVDAAPAAVAKPAPSVQAIKGASDEVDAYVIQGDEEYDLFNEEPLQVTSAEGAAAVVEDEELAWDEIEEAADNDAEVIHFDYDRYEIRPEESAHIERNVPRVKQAQAEGATVVVEGHSCKLAKSKIHNYKISEKRADAIADEYAKKGADRSKLKVVGRGDSMLLTNEEQLQHVNRRVETKVIYPKQS